MVFRDPTSSSLVMMLCSTKPKNDVMVTTKNKYYVNLSASTGQVINQPVSSIASIPDPTPNMVPTKLMIKTLNGVIHKYRLNPHARVAQNYNIIEDLNQAPCAMSTPDVLQKFSMQNNTLLSIIICIDH